MAKYIIAPAVLEREFSSVASGVSLVKTFSNVIQVDVVDTTFVQEPTYGAEAHIDEYTRLADVCEQLTLELDLMVQIDKRFDAWIDAVRISGARRVVVHEGTTTQYEELLERLHAMGILVGLGVHIGGTLEDSLALFEKGFDFVQVMGIAQIGVQGSAFDTRSLEIVRAFRAAHNEIDIAVDGGVKKENMRDIIHAGANRLCVGSAIMKTDDPAQAYADIHAHVER